MKRKFKIGDKVKLKKSAMLTPDEAYDMNCIGGARTERMTQKNAEDYFMFMLIVEGYPVKSVIISDANVMGNYQVQHVFRNKRCLRHYVEPENLLKVKNVRKSK